MYEVVERFEDYLRDKGFIVHEIFNHATGHRVIAWIHDNKMIAGSCPAKYFDKFYTDGEANDGIDEKNIGAPEFQMIIDKFTDEF